MYFAVRFPEVCHGTNHADLPLAAGEVTEDHHVSDDEVLAVCHSSDCHFLVVMSARVVTLFSCYPFIRKATYYRADTSIHDYGRNVSFVCRPDMLRIAVTTTKGFVLVLTLHVVEPIRVGDGRPIIPTGHAPDLKFGTATALSRPSTAVMTHTITAIVARKADLLVATTAGAIERVPWDTPVFDATSAIVLTRSVGAALSMTSPGQWEQPCQ